MPALDRPRIVVTVAVASRQEDPGLASRKNARYAEAIERHGGRPVLLDADASGPERTAAFETMDGVLLTGGGDIDPARYGRPNVASREIDLERDELEAAAWAAAEARHMPVLGICRGFQAINVFSGGTLLQDVEGHAGPGWSTGPAWMHPIRIKDRGHLGAAIAGGDGNREIAVNTYHHQAVTATDLAPGLVATAWADSPGGPIVEALEAASDRFVVGVQCHPERTEFTPPEFERLWEAFVAACARAGESAGGAPGYSRPASITR
jgi:gamma-glutamyl-gamma-aminobutyrate hydrolase PuuD